MTTAAVLALFAMPGLQAQVPAAQDSAGGAAADTAGAPGSGPLVAEDADRPSDPHLRENLQQRLDSLEAARQTAEKEEKRKALDRQIERIRERLTIGDFEPGQQVHLEVAQMPRWTGNFTIRDDRTLKLPGIEPIPLEGVLRTEAPSKVEDALGEYIRDPEVRFESLRRIAVLGAVTNPGFYHLPAEVTVSEAIMQAGGPTQEADMNDFKVERDGESLDTQDSPFRVQGRTLAQLDLRSGDVLRVPAGGEGIQSWLVAAGSVGSVLGVALAIF